MSRETILRSPSTTLPLVHDFLGAYFHEDWVAEHEDWEEVVEQFRSETEPGQLRATALQLRGLTGAGLTDEELRAVFAALDCSVEPSAWGMSPSRWIGLVRDRLS